MRTALYFAAASAIPATAAFALPYTPLPHAPASGAEAVQTSILVLVISLVRCCPRQTLAACIYIHLRIYTRLYASHHAACLPSCMHPTPCTATEQLYMLDGIWRHCTLGYIGTHLAAANCGPAPLAAVTRQHRTAARGPAVGTIAHQPSCWQCQAQPGGAFSPENWRR